MRTRKTHGVYKLKPIKRGGMAVQGEQGCVTIPSLVIDAKKTRSMNYVTKLFFEEKYFNEEKANDDFILKEIDPRQSFTVVAYDMNPINVKVISTSELEKCPSLKGKDLSNLKFLNYKYAGISIASIIENNTVFDKNSSKDLIAALANLTVKVFGMNSVGFFHKDAHEGNIMYNPKDKHAYLIDFGHASKGSDKPLWDMQSMLICIRLVISNMLAFSKLPPNYIELLTAYKNDITQVITKLDVGMSTEEGLNLAMKAATDFSFAYSRLGGSRKTLRRTRHKINRYMH